MSAKARLALFVLVVLSFAGSAGLLLVAARWLEAPASAATAIARAAGRFASDHRVARDVVALRLAADGTPAAPVASSSFFTGDDEQLPFAVIGSGGEQTTVMMGRQTPGLRRLLRDRDAKVVWFERDGTEYVIRDAATFGRAQRIVEPIESLGRAMGELGGRMGRIGARQGRVGGEMGRLGGRLGRLEGLRVEARMRGEDDASLDREIRDVRIEMDRLREQLDRSGDRTDLEESRSRMEELRGRHAAALRRVREDMRSLIEDSLRDGRAQRLDFGA